MFSFGAYFGFRNEWLVGVQSAFSLQ